MVVSMGAPWVSCPEPPGRRHTQDDVTSERQLVRLVLCCQVDVLSGHGNNICEVVERCSSSNTSTPQCRHLCVRKRREMWVEVTLWHEL